MSVNRLEVCVFILVRMYKSGLKYCEEMMFVTGLVETLWEVMLCYGNIRFKLVVDIIY